LAPRYDVEVKVDVTAERMGWPAGGAIRHGLDNNRLFEDLSHATWADVAHSLETEADLLERCLRDAANPDEFEDLLSQALDDEWDSLETCLDFGTVSAALALNAAGCRSFTSCSGHHHGCGYPQVVFWARPEQLALLLQAAHAANVGLLAGDSGGWLELYSDSMDGLMRFARAMLGLGPAFDGSSKGQKRPRPAKRAPA